MKSYNLLTAKPVIYAANVAEDDLADDGAANQDVQEVREYAAKEQGAEVFVCLCTDRAGDLLNWMRMRKKMFLEDLGLTESGLEKLIKASYQSAGTDQLS